MKRFFKISMFPCVVVAVLVALFLKTGGAEAAPLTCGTWSAVPSPSIASNNAFLNGVAAVSSNNVWAVGNNGSALIENWNGQQWSIVSSPNAGTASLLNAVTSVSGTKQLWAVGDYFGPTSEQTLVDFWNGRTWSIVPSPNLKSAFNSLNGVAAVSANDVWAVGGYYYNGSPGQSLIEHWNGHKWRIIKSPSPGSSSTLFGVPAVSEDNVWAVGAYQTSSGEQSLIEHWNGHKWSVVANPGVGTALGGITSVSGTNELWAVGPNVGTYNVPTLIEHWNGSAWSIVPSPSPGAGFNALPSVAALAANDVWAVGYYTNGEVPILTLIEHWDGTSWSVVSSPNPSPAADYLYAVTRVPGTSQLWAAGFNAANQYNQPLIEFYC